VRGEARKSHCAVIMCDGGKFLSPLRSAEPNCWVRVFRTCERRIWVKVSIAIVLFLALVTPSAPLDIARHARPPDGQPLVIIFPRPGQTLCSADQFEILALYKGDPNLPQGHMAVLAYIMHVSRHRAFCMLGVDTLSDSCDRW